MAEKKRKKKQQHGHVLFLISRFFSNIFIKLVLLQYSHPFNFLKLFYNHILYYTIDFL